MPKLFGQDELMAAEDQVKAESLDPSILGLMKKYNDLAKVTNSIIYPEQGETLKTADTPRRKSVLDRLSSKTKEAAISLEKQGYKVDSIVLDSMIALNKYLISHRDSEQAIKIRSEFENSAELKLNDTYRKIKSYMSDDKKPYRGIKLPVLIETCTNDLMEVDQAFVNTSKLIVKGFLGVAREAFRNKTSTTVKEPSKGLPQTNLLDGDTSKSSLASFSSTSQEAKKKATESAKQAGVDGVNEILAKVGSGVATAAVQRGRRQQQEPVKTKSNNKPNH